MQELIKIQNLSLIQNSTEILSDISLSILKRDFITIIGPNGAGKTSLLKIILQIYKPSSGNISLNPNLSIGYVPQNNSITNSLPITVKEFLSLRNNKNILSKQELIANINMISEDIGISRLLNQSMSSLSGGQRQKIFLARALLCSPNLLILDEPTQNLDISSQKTFYKLLNKIYQKNNIAIVMISHDLNLVMSSTTQVICLFRHICCFGTPESIRNKSEFRSLFGDDMDNMLMFYSHSHDHSHEH